MPTAKRKLPPSFEKKSQRLRAALEAYVAELRQLRKKRGDITQRFMKKVDDEKIAEAKRLIDSL